MHTKLTILERLKDLRVSEKRMSLQELSDATGIPSSTLGNYEKDKNIDMSLGNLITLANFYNISTDYLLCRTELRKHKNQSVSDLHLNDDAVQILTGIISKNTTEPFKILHFVISAVFCPVFECFDCFLAFCLYVPFVQSIHFLISPLSMIYFYKIHPFGFGYI